MLFREAGRRLLVIHSGSEFGTASLESSGNLLRHSEAHRAFPLAEREHEAAATPRRFPQFGLIAEPGAFERVDAPVDDREFETLNKSEGLV